MKIEIELTKDGSCYYAENLDLGICSSGFDVADAVKEFADQFEYIFHNYRYRNLKDGVVTGLSEEIKKKYENLERLDEQTSA